MALQGQRTSIRYLLACVTLIVYILLVMFPMLVQPEIVTLGLAGAALVGTLAGASYLTRPWCYKWECCMDDWIPGNTTGKQIKCM